MRVNQFAAADRIRQAPIEGVRVDRVMRQRAIEYAEQRIFGFKLCHNSEP